MADHLVACWAEPRAVRSVAQMAAATVAKMAALKAVSLVVRSVDKTEQRWADPMASHSVACSAALMVAYLAERMADRWAGWTVSVKAAHWEQNWAVVMVAT